MWSASLLSACPKSVPRWSPLEYGCDVRDVYHKRLQLMLEADDPEFGGSDHRADLIAREASDIEVAFWACPLQDPGPILRVGDYWHGGLLPP